MFKMDISVKTYLIFNSHLMIYFFKGFTSSSIAEEKQYNPRLTKNREDFINFMSNLQLAYPKMIDRAVPANMTCGLFDQAREENK